MHPRYGWVSTTRSAAVQEVMASCIAAWLCDWCVRGQAIATDVDLVQHLDAGTREEAAQMLECERGALLVAMDGHQTSLLGLRLAAIASHEADLVAPELANAALTDLMSRIGSRAGLHGAGLRPLEGPWPEAVVCPEWGALALRVRLADVEMTIAMDRTVVNGIAPEQATTSALDDRVRSLRATDVPITAILDFGEISMRDLAGLHVGEVLVSERKVGQLAELRIGSTRVAEAMIGSIGNHLAVVATATADSKEHP